MGNTSVQYAVEVFCDDIQTGREDTVFNTGITLVCLDQAGNKARVPRDEAEGAG